MARHMVSAYRRSHSQSLAVNLHSLLRGESDDQIHRFDMKIAFCSLIDVNGAPAASKLSSEVDAENVSASAIVDIALDDHDHTAAHDRRIGMVRPRISRLPTIRFVGQVERFGGRPGPASRLYRSPGVRHEGLWQTIAT